MQTASPPGGDAPRPRRKRFFSPVTAARIDIAPAVLARFQPAAGVGTADFAV
jgi:hypothetical protein